MAMAPQVRALVPAAGRGERLGAGSPKQYLPLAGKTLLWHSVERLLAHPGVQGVTVVLAEGDQDFDTLSFSRSGDVDHCTGGASRAESVRNGLRHIAHAHAADWVLVHDAARPCLPRACLDELLQAGLECDDGALLALPVADTLKAADADERVRTTLARESLWAAQTPQLFPLVTLLAAVQAQLDAGETPTDEAMAMERAGFHPRLVRGSPANLKVTWPADLALAEAWLGSRCQAKAHMAE